MSPDKFNLIWGSVFPFSAKAWLFGLIPLGQSLSFYKVTLKLNLVSSKPHVEKITRNFGVSSNSMFSKRFTFFMRTFSKKVFQSNLRERCVKVKNQLCILLKKHSIFQEVVEIRNFPTGKMRGNLGSFFLRESPSVYYALFEHNTSNCRNIFRCVAIDMNYYSEALPA